MKKLKYILLPIAWIYALVVWIRHKMFDAGILKTRRFKIPVICVGNITVGGTGKTPFVEYLIRILQDKYPVAVVSRGYKRKSRGMQVSSENSTAEELGDEPYQILKKYPKTLVIADSNRCRAIDFIEKNHPEVKVVILDDAYQHRYVKTRCKILLIDYNRPIKDDYLLPYGQLRDLPSAQKRASIIVVTKCPKDLKPIDYRNLLKQINPFPYQKVFFSAIDYDTPFRYSTGEKVELSDKMSLLLFTGIARSESLEEYLKTNVSELYFKRFSDHHNYSVRDNECILSEFNNIKSKNKWIITTEKDASKVNSFHSKIKDNLIIIPIRISILQENESQFSKKISDYVEKNRRNGLLLEG